MLVAHYDSRDDVIHLEGDAMGLLELVRAIGSEPDPMTVNLAPQANDGRLDAIHIRKDGTKSSLVEITRNGSTLQLLGSRANLAVLASNIEFLIKQGVDQQGVIQNHIHVEYYPEHPYLSERAISLTINFRAVYAA